MVSHMTTHLLKFKVKDVAALRYLGLYLSASARLIPVIELELLFMPYGHTLNTSI